MTVENLREFRAGLREIESEITDEIEDEVIGKVTLDIFADATRQSPVDSGRFRSAWVTSKRTPSSFVPPEVSTRSGRTTRVNQGAAVRTAQASEVGVTNYIVNNLPYAEILAEGFSPQREAGWIDAIITRVLRTVF